MNLHSSEKIAITTKPGVFGNTGCREHGESEKKRTPAGLEPAQLRDCAKPLNMESLTTQDAGNIPLEKKPDENPTEKNTTTELK